MPTVLPALDPIPLPAPVWLLTALLLLTFVLHVVPMMVVLGGGFWAILAARRAADPAFAALARRIAKALPYWTAAAVTTGVAALLFLQVLYGPVFYASTVVMAWPWLAVVGLVLAGYYGYYFRSYRLERSPRAAFWVGVLAWLGFVAVAFVFVNEMTLMLHPERLPALYAANRSGEVLNLREPTLWPRYLHMVTGAIAGGALWIAWLGSRAAGPEGARIVGFGARGFLAAVLAAVGSGGWFVAALPGPVASAFAGGAALPTAALVLSAGLTAVAAWWVSRAARPERTDRPLLRAIVAAVLVAVLMVLMRHDVRARTLGAAARLDEMRVAPQWPIIVVFAALLLVGVATVVWMLAISRAPAVERAKQLP